MKTMPQTAWWIVRTLFWSPDPLYRVINWLSVPNMLLPFCEPYHVGVTWARIVCWAVWLVLFLIVFIRDRPIHSMRRTLAATEAIEQHSPEIAHWCWEIVRLGALKHEAEKSFRPAEEIAMLDRQIAEAEARAQRESNIMKSKMK